MIILNLKAIYRPTFIRNNCIFPEQLRIWDEKRFPHVDFFFYDLIVRRCLILMVVVIVTIFG